ncbi:alpha/beta hydrolase [Pedobacter rhizosphaerae]|uniref:Predicted hydrolase of the alpha/beta superfamily n=1 Tax=Pedobacter rhizosphaerae TaxID=390241 RepID=A0A1H9N8V6_9SPHI|nr:alpha/beta hydrolase-fold protein [Pedobacter rhizosphaerae]SER32364.1 Predicted hydrolase of the alpha/beta superfamily [Pedobacter rhizosphaerae]
MPEKYQYGDHVHLLSDAFYMPQLNRYRKIQIYLPKGYNKSEKRYPVIYMQDGQQVFHTQPPRNNEWAVDKLVDELIRSGSEERIVVGIYHNEEKRFNEYSPFNGEHGQAEGTAYAAFIAETLKPFVDENYRTLTDSQNTAIAGGSLGGLISLYTIASYPEVFGSAGIFSPSLWYAPEIFQYIAERRADLQQHQIYFVVGGKEGETMINEVLRMYQLINPDHSNPNILVSNPADGRHKEWFWHREFAAFYQFINK